MDDCYDGPAPCVTQGELDDLGIAIAAAQSDVDSAQSEYDDVCYNYPESCGEADNRVIITSGPSSIDAAVGPCSSAAWDATEQLLESGITLASLYLGYEAAVASGLSLTAAGAAVVLGVVAATSFMAGYYVGVWLACALPIEHILANAASLFAPESVYRSPGVVTARLGIA